MNDDRNFDSVSKVPRIKFPKASEIFDAPQNFAPASAPAILHPSRPTVEMENNAAVSAGISQVQEEYARALEITPVESTRKVHAAGVEVVIPNYLERNSVKYKQEYFNVQ